MRVARRRHSNVLAVGLDLQEVRGILVRSHYGPTVHLLRLEEASAIEADIAGEDVQIAGGAANETSREGVTELVIREDGRAEQHDVFVVSP